MIVNIVLVSYIDDAYWDDPTGTTEDIQATEFMEDGSMENYFNISVWEFGVVKQII